MLTLRQYSSRLQRVININIFRKTGQLETETPAEKEERLVKEFNERKKRNKW